MPSSMSNGPVATRIGMVRCEHCQRQFNPHSAARHIPWCKKQNETRRRHLTADKLEALERYRWRIGYKPSNLITSRPKQNFVASSAADRNGQKRYQASTQKSQAPQVSHRTKSYREVDWDDSQEDDEFSGDGKDDSETDEYDERQRLATAAGQLRTSQMDRRAQSGSNTSATFSSPSASSVTSLNNPAASTSNNTNTNNNNNNKLNHARANASSLQQQLLLQQRTGPASRTQHGKLVRSVSSVTLNKRQPGSASSSNSRVSAATIRPPDDLNSRPHQKGRPQPRQNGAMQLEPMRTKSVSDLSNMGEIVETLAKRMEEIYAQNQLLLDSIIRSKRLACDNNETNLAAVNRAGDGTVQDDGIDASDWSAEFGQCHHCRARCLVEANFCHKCGCKMRPSNPTPPTPE